MQGVEASKNMTEPKRLSEIEIVSQSLAFMESQKKWNEKINKPQVKTEAEKEYYKKVYGDPEPYTHLTYDEAKGLFWRTAKSLIPDYQIQDKETYQNLVKYFFGQECNLDTSKGLLIIGGTGCGKTQLFKAMQQTLFNTIIPSYRICECINTEYAIRSGNSVYEDFNAGMVCFDDLGSEQIETVVFGNRVTVMNEILQLRYNSFQRSGLKTHLTSNLSEAEIESKYGTRIFDRLKEMCNIVIFDWQSFRK